MKESADIHSKQADKRWLHCSKKVSKTVCLLVCKSACLPVPSDEQVREFPEQSVSQSVSPSIRQSVRQTLCLSVWNRRREIKSKKKIKKTCLLSIYLSDCESTRSSSSLLSTMEKRYDELNPKDCEDAKNPMRSSCESEEEDGSVPIKLTKSVYKNN